MQNKTIDGVSRAAIEILLSGKGGLAQAAAAHELRALLDAPECRTTTALACPGDGVGPCKRCPGEKGQGEPVESTPVAYLDLSEFAGGGMAYATAFHAHDSQAPLYDRPAAPAKVGPTLVLCLNEYFDSGMRGPPSEDARALGVSWEEFVPCPMADRIILKGCTGVPEQLPSWLQRAKGEA